MSKTPTQFDIALLEKPGTDGLTAANVRDLFSMLNDTEAYPLEIENAAGDSSAMGFITTAAADKLNYNYDLITENIQTILGDMNKEDPMGIYRMQDLDVYIGRD